MRQENITDMKKALKICDPPVVMTRKDNMGWEERKEKKKKDTKKQNQTEGGQSH